MPAAFDTPGSVLNGPLIDVACDMDDADDRAAEAERTRTPVSAAISGSPYDTRNDFNVKSDATLFAVVFR